MTINAIRRLAMQLTGTMLALALPLSASAGGLTRDALADWLDRYGAAWEARDADLAASLFSAGATYQVTPYEEPHRGPAGVRAYWADVTAGQRNVQFGYEILAVAGNTGIAHWHAAFDVADSPAHLRLNGIFVLDFDADGRCSRLREWWHLDAGEAAATAQ
jgi:hypothetical protein